MRLLVITTLVCQILFCNSQEIYSALSCILRRSGDYALTDIQQQSDESINLESDDDSLLSQVSFRVYTQQYPNGKEIIFKDEKSLEESGFESGVPTRICTHGFGGRGDGHGCMGPAKAFLTMGKFNIVVMDWSKYQSLSYFTAVKQVKVVGLHLSEMINFLEEHGMDVSTTTLIGHSLGAHVVGIASFNSQSKINHVVGVDPAEPGFTSKGIGERISKEDAAHVEIIHANGGHCGMQEAVGHYDFYLNGGSKQPGCSRNSCSHSRSNSYYVESITSSIGFYGRRCDDSNIIEKENCTGEIALMGGLTRDVASPGVYFVETNSKSPYAKGYPGIF